MNTDALSRFAAQFSKSGQKSEPKTPRANARCAVCDRMARQVVDGVNLCDECAADERTPARLAVRQAFLQMFLAPIEERQQLFDDAIRLAEKYRPTETEVWALQARARRENGRIRTHGIVVDPVNPFRGGR